MVRRGLLLALLPVAFLVGGCDLLFGMGGQAPPPRPDEVDFSFPPPVATFTKGSATVTIDGVTTVLDVMPRPGALYETFGVDAGWTDGNGLYLRLYGQLGIGVARGEAYVVLDRVRDGQHWTTSDRSDCGVTVDQADAAGIKGSGSCSDRRWGDAMAGLTGPQPVYVEGETPFDLSVTFEARP